MHNFKKKILISLLLVLITLLAGFVANFYRHMNLHIQADTLEKVTSLKKLFNSQLDEDAQAMRGVLDIILFDEQIKTALKNKDKSALFDLAMPFFNKLKTNHQVSHFYFTDPDRINILRVHKPEKYGDRIDRHTTIKAKKSQDIYSGIELGTLGTFTLRVVAPWYEDGRLIGFVELGEEIEHITQQLKAIMDVELFILIEKKFLTRKTWETGMHMLNKTAAWNQFQFYAMIDQTDQKFPEDLTRFFSGAASPPLTSNIELASGHEKFSAGFIPLMEANGQQVGFMVMTYRITSMISDVHSTLLRVTAIYIMIGSGLFVLFFIFLSKIEQQMKKDSQALVISEKQLSRAQKIANVGHWSWDIKNGTLGWSDEIYRIFGLQPQEFGATYEAFLEVVHPDDRDAVTQAVDRAVNDRQPYSIEHRIKRKRGEIRIVQEVGEVSYSGDGVPLGMVGTVQDITERKQAEKELKRYQEELEELVEEKSASITAIVETAPDGIVTIDADGSVMTFNAAAEKIFGYSAQEIIGCNFSMLAAPSCMKKNFARINTYIETGKGYKPGNNIEAEGRTKDGQIFPILMAVSEMVIAGEKQFTGIIRDITDIKEVQNELIAAKEAAEKASRAKSVFLANMSHEIRTPMNGILGMTNLALKTALDEKQQNYITKASDSAQRLLRILNDILDFSKMEADKMEIETADFHLPDVFNNLLNVIQLKADEKNIDLTISMKPEIPRALIGDPLRLGQVLINLGGNAIKFSNPGGSVSFKVVLLEKTSQTVTLKFSVTDTGIGMSHDQMDKLFLPFSQADSTINRKYGGTGLGLIISQKIIRLMGGKIWVESKKGSGSTFHFTVRLGKQDEHPKQMDTSDSLTQKTINQALASISGCRILLVEDNEINQELVFELLTSNNMMVETAGNGVEALSLLKTKTFDAVLMDLQMPVMDGYEATRKIREQTKLQDLPIIALTANAMAGDREKALAAGMNDHIAKPLNPDEMYVIVAKWIQQNNL